jgi:hypothetical protein
MAKCTHEHTQPTAEKLSRAAYSSISCAPCRTTRRYRGVTPYRNIHAAVLGDHREAEGLRRKPGFTAYIDLWTSTWERGSRRQVQRYRGAEVQRYRGTEVQRYRGTEVQRYRGTEVQRYRGTEVQRVVQREQRGQTTTTALKTDKMRDQRPQKTVPHIAAPAGATLVCDDPGECLVQGPT